MSFLQEVNTLFTKITLTSILAVWGAFWATIVLFWDVYKWRTQGPRLKIYAGLGYRIIGGLDEDTNNYLNVTVCNVGDGKTTITNLGLEYYESWIDSVTKRNGRHFICANPISSQKIPYPLDAGEQWGARSIQNADIEKMALEGHLYCAVHYSNSDKPARKRLVPKNHNTSQTS